MQPQEPSTGPPSQFDFMMADSHKPKSGFRLPLPNLPKPILLVVGVLVILIVIIVAASFFSRSRNSVANQLVDIMARAQEIARVSTLAEPEVQTSETKALAATTQAALSSEQQQLGQYLSSRKFKFSEKSLVRYLDQNIESQLELAAQNGNLDETYINYLKKQLADYNAALQKAYLVASPNTQAILSEAFSSTKVLLSAPQISN